MIREDLRDGVPAALWRRAGAYLLDSIFLSVISWVAALPVLGGLYFFETTQDPLLATGFLSWMGAQGLWIEGLNFGVYVIVAAILTAEGLYRWGSSPGKWVFRFWVTGAVGNAPLTRRQAWMRTLALGASYGTLGVGFLVAAFHPRRQALHDLLTRTWCVQRRHSSMAQGKYQ